MSDENCDQMEQIGPSIGPMSSGTVDKTSTGETEREKALEKTFNDFWLKIEERTSLTISHDLRPILNRLGCANELALSDLSSERVDKLEEFARKHLSKKIKTQETLDKVFGIFSDDPASFEFMPGHRFLLEAIGEKMKTTSHLTAPPSKRSESRVEDSKRLKRNESPREGQDKSGVLAEEENNLRRGLRAGLSNECSIQCSEDNLLFTVSLTNDKEGTIVCLIENCGRVLKVSRTNSRPWGKQNFCRHVRDIHSVKELPNRQRSLSDLGFNVTDKENSSDASGENRREVGRTVRQKRALEKAAIGSHLLTEYWPLITKLESVIRENEQLHSTVRILINRIADHDAVQVLTQMPGLSPFLQALVISAMKNCEKKKGGERYERDLTLIASHFFMVAGRQAYTDLHLNLQKIIPSPSAVLRMIEKSKVVPRPGEFLFEKLSDFLTARGYPRAVNLSMDGTRCVARIQYDPITNQMVGFVPELEEGIPVLDSFPATSELVMRKYFETKTPGRIMTCIVARPLVRGAPSFCLCAFPTDNKYSTADVLKLLNYTEKVLSKYAIRVAAHGSDGDTRSLGAMRIRMFPPCDNSLAWHLWFRSSLHTDVACIQDPVHIATKLRNLMLRDHVLCMGTYFVSTSHVRFLIDETSKDNHLLNMSDIDPKDRMNYRSMEKLCSQTVTEMMRKTVPDSEGTCTFLEMARAVVDALIDRSLIPAERIYMIWEAVFFYRAWRKWVTEHPSYTLSKNFLTSNAYMCIELNAHSLILIVRYHRLHPDDVNLGEFLPWMWGSQDCEDLFRMMRSMTSTFSTVINFSPLEFLNRISRTGLEQKIRHELGPKFRFSENKRGAKKTMESFVPGRDDFPSDQEILQIIANSKQGARIILDKLGMDIEIPDVFTSLPEEQLDSDNEDEFFGDESASVPQESADEDELDFSEDLAISSIFTNEVGLRTFEDAEVTPESPFVKVTDFYGNQAIIKKTSLTWMLSTRETVSTDRGLPYQIPATPSPSPQLPLRPSALWRPPVHEEHLELGDWCAFQDGREMVIGRVLQFCYLTGKKKKYSLRSAPTAPPPGVQARGLGVLGHWYTVDPCGEMQRSDKGFISMENYKFTTSRPVISQEVFHMDLRTMQLLSQ